MGTPKRQSQRTVRPPPARNSRPRTRLHKPRLITDPAESTLQLTNQLRALGLYAAPTLGDGNCLFRALADQLWGSPNDHLRLRAEVCDWMAAHAERYEPFVDEDECDVHVHIRRMRIPGTYGGHLELSAFAHLKRRNVKVIQPGLVYVIEWAGGWASEPDPNVHRDDDEPQGGDLSPRDRRRLRRDKKRHEEDEEDDDVGESAVYVAYHDWEHFSSVRNLAGPHTGPPYVVEKQERSAPARARSASQSTSIKTIKGKSRAAIPSPPVVLSPPSPESEPEHVPLPSSRSVSPLSSLSVPPSQATTTTSTSASRSPKRTFDEQEERVPGEPESSTSRSSKRVKKKSFLSSAPLSVPSSVPPSTVSSSGSSESSPAPPTPPSLSTAHPLSAAPDLDVVIDVDEPPRERDRPLTRRQRKALGLPKPRTVLVKSSSAARTGSARTRASAGRIVIPGGRFAPKPGESDGRGVDDDDDVPGEWVRNGTGRLDVRGFRELRI